MPGKWLKKYTKLPHLDGILMNKRLFLGDPTTWEDKNDAFCLDHYASSSSKKSIRATCLTGASDRFHFWYIFGGCMDGVCLWFDRKALLLDIKDDKTLVHGECKYKRPEGAKKLTWEEIPFAKRKQYKDEKEYRVLRYDGDDNHFSFSPQSLKRIYLNPWLCGKERSDCKKAIENRLKDELKHVELKQNRTLEFENWKKAIESI